MIRLCGSTDSEVEDHLARALVRKARTRGHAAVARRIESATLLKINESKVALQLNQLAPESRSNWDSWCDSIIDNLVGA